MKKKSILIYTGIVLTLSLLVYFSIKHPSEDFSEKEKEKLAKCLTEKEIYLYGSVNCPNCEIQKEKFGSAVEFITYINCYFERDLCSRYSDKKTYPFWGMGDSIIKGPIPLKKLKEKTGC